MIVQKYGGASLASPEQFSKIAERIARLRQTGETLVVVVSAMGKTTDSLIELAHQVAPTPSPREMDMLISTGERVSMALMSMALENLGCPAISFTGSQAGILTTDQHSNADILEVRPWRVDEALQKGQVVVLAGFQGVSPQTKEITTLGRGGSDTTAMAVAQALKATRLEFRKEVNGIFTADPHRNASAQKVNFINKQQLLDITLWGTQILHFKAARYAQNLTTPVHFLNTFADVGEGTQLVSEEHSKDAFSQISSHRPELLRCNLRTYPGGVRAFHDHFAHLQYDVPFFDKTSGEAVLARGRAPLTEISETLKTQKLQHECFSAVAQTHSQKTTIQHPAPFSETSGYTKISLQPSDLNQTTSRG